MSEIKNWLVRGDVHGVFAWMPKILKGYKPEETAIIILGDLGIDYFLNHIDERKKKEIDERGYYIYGVRGNHEARASDIPTYNKIYDENVKGTVYCDSRFPHIRFFLDYGFYNINNYTCFVIGGAYSVDKWYRLARCAMTEETNIPKKSGWFANEQLSADEMTDCFQRLKLFGATGKAIDFIFAHTCPYSWEPRELFLGGVDQSTVDNTMEHWLDKVVKIVPWYIYLFGHFHDDQLVRPHVEMFYHDIDKLDNIYYRWAKYDETKELDWWLKKSPNFDAKD